MKKRLIQSMPLVKIKFAFTIAVLLTITSGCSKSVDQIESEARTRALEFLKSNSYSLLSDRDKAMLDGVNEYERIKIKGDYEWRTDINSDLRDLERWLLKHSHHEIVEANYDPETKRTEVKATWNFPSLLYTVGGFAEGIGEPDDRQRLVERFEKGSITYSDLEFFSTPKPTLEVDSTGVSIGAKQRLRMLEIADSVSGSQMFIAALPESDSTDADALLAQEADIKRAARKLRRAYNKIIEMAGSEDNVLFREWSPLPYKEVGKAIHMLVDLELLELARENVYFTDLRPTSEDEKLYFTFNVESKKRLDLFAIFCEIEYLKKGKVIAVQTENPAFSADSDHQGLCGVKLNTDLIQPMAWEVMNYSAYEAADSFRIKLVGTSAPFEHESKLFDSVSASFDD